MAVQITDENLAQYLAQLTQSLESEDGARGARLVIDLDEIGNNLSLPGVLYDSDPITNPDASAEEYVQIPYSIIKNILSAMDTAVEEVEQINISLSDAVITVTDRDGVSYSENIRGPQGEKGDKGDRGENLVWQTMTEAERQELVNAVIEQIEKYSLDNTPKPNSTKPVTSQGIWNAIQQATKPASTSTCESIIDELT